MAARRKDYSKRYDELMRNAGAARRKAAIEALEGERRSQRAQRRARLKRISHDPMAEVRAAILDRLEVLRANNATGSKIARRFREEEIAKLEAQLARWDELKRNRRRKPPESGLAVPAVPPKGPLPKQGGAEAPVDFDA